MMKSTKCLVIGVALVMGGSAHAQFILNSVSGSFTDGASNAYNVGDIVDGYAVLSGSGSNASFGMSNRAHTGDDYNFPARTVAAFRAQNFNPGGSGDTLDVQLPSDRSGGTSTATDGEVRVFGLTSNNYAGTNNTYTFNGSIASTGTSGAEIAMESAGLSNVSPYTANVASGSYFCTNLDNGAWDLDPTVGNVVINNSVTSSVILNFTIPDYTVIRSELSFFGSDFSNPFWDRYHSDMLFFMSGTNGYSVSADRYSTGLQQAPNDMSALSLTGASGTLVLDFTNLSGTYSFFGGDLIWDHMGDTEGFPNVFYPATGTHRNFQQLNVQVVPEPATMTGIAIGLAAMLRRRKKA